MNFSKLFALIAFVILVFIGVLGIWKHFNNPVEITNSLKPVEITLDNNDVQEEILFEETPQEEPPAEELVVESPDPTKPVPSADRIEELFSTTGEKLDIVETISYSRKVPWIRGRPAWLVDYAYHYHTSRYFISRSLSGAKRADYFYQNYTNGDRFNVLKKDKNISFYLVVDISRAYMWLYALDEDLGIRTLIKTYDVCLGRTENTISGSLTPLGKYSLGDRVTIYKNGMKGFFNNKNVEMISVFGTRWIPFEKELENCSAPAKGLGIHGTPWKWEAKLNKYVDATENIGKYESDGCIRLSTNDIEELYSIVISRKTVIELVKDFYDAKLPGKET